MDIVAVACRSSPVGVRATAIRPEPPAGVVCGPHFIWPASVQMLRSNACSRRPSVVHSTGAVRARQIGVGQRDSAGCGVCCRSAPIRSPRSVAIVAASSSCLLGSQSLACHSLVRSVDRDPASHCSAGAAGQADCRCVARLRSVRLLVWSGAADPARRLQPMTTDTLTTAARGRGKKEEE